MLAGESGRPVFGRPSGKASPGMRLALLGVFSACATTPAAGRADEVRVEAIALDLLSDGKGTVGFVLDLESPAGESCTVTRVEWQMMLAGRDFAAGVTSTNVLVPGGQSAYATSEYSIKAKMGERQLDSGGLETLVLMKDAAGNWKIRHSHTSSRPRRPQA